MLSFTEFLIEGRGFEYQGSRYSSFGKYYKRDGESISKEEYQKASEGYKTSKSSKSSTPKDKIESKPTKKLQTKIKQDASTTSKTKKKLTPAEKLSKLQKKLPKLSDDELRACNFDMINYSYRSHELTNLRDDVVGAYNYVNSAYIIGNKKIIKDAEKKADIVSKNFSKSIENKDIGTRIEYTIKSDGYGSSYDVIKVSKNKWRDIMNNESFTDKELVNTMLDSGDLHIYKTGFLTIK